jgi:hypothetical protein
LSKDEDPIFDADNENAISRAKRLDMQNLDRITGTTVFNQVLTVPHE